MHDVSGSAGALYVGVMSGTSLDGVDVVLCRIEHTCIELVSSLEYPLDTELKHAILELLVGDCTLKDVGEIDHRLGSLFADAVLALIKQSGCDKARVTAVGLHGQTVWHQPDSVMPFTMQIGDPNIVAARTGIQTVADFRRKDMALGGQGAPFAPAFHQFLFGKFREKTAVVNIGGIANITLLGQPLLGYDTGPGNVLLDFWCQAAFGKPYDRDGAIAQKGEIDEVLLNNMLDDDYFSQLAPKSTGREYFNADWLQPYVKASMRSDSVLATLTELTARTIADAVRRYGVMRLLLCGGGAKNIFLRERIVSLLEGIEVERTDHYGVPGDWMEALAFAWLAYKRVNEEPVALHHVTGASCNTILGALYA